MIFSLFVNRMAITIESGRFGRQMKNNYCGEGWPKWQLKVYTWDSVAAFSEQNY